MKDLQSRINSSKSKINELNILIQKLREGQVEKVYIAKKADKIDVALGEFINQYPEKGRIKILFLRESEGVYQFGARKIFIKIEKGNNLLVKVGGGFMHIHDFIEQYTHEEVAKISRRNVLERFSHKLALQTIAIDSELMVETSPIRSPQRAMRSRSRSMSPLPKGKQPTTHLQAMKRRWSNSKIYSPKRGGNSPVAQDLDLTDLHCHGKDRHHGRRSPGAQESQPTQKKKGKTRKSGSMTG